MTVWLQEDYLQPMAWSIYGKNASLVPFCVTYNLKDVDLLSSYIKTARNICY